MMSGSQRSVLVVAAFQAPFDRLSATGAEHLKRGVPGGYLSS